MENSKKDIRGASLNRKKAALITLCAIALVLAALILSFFLAGFRYKKLKYVSAVDGSETNLSFLGFVDRAGALSEGTLFYDNAKASVSKNSDGAFVLTYANGDMYVGDMYGLQRVGNGKMTYATGEAYVGSFKNDKFHGIGTYTYANGDVYTGSFSGGKKSGSGRYVWAENNGKSAVYEGSFSSDMRNGFGVYTESNGTVYEGNFVNDLREDDNASVHIVTSSGEIDRYFGGYKNDKRNGFGYYFYANGDVYVGEFLNDALNGSGIIYRVTGGSFSGTFEKGKIVDGTAVELSAEEAAKQLEELRKMTN